MKKLGLFVSLLICSILFAGCNPTNPEPEIIDDCVIPEDCAVEEPAEEPTEEIDDIMNDKKLLSLYPGIQESDWNVILGDTLQTNYVNGTNNLYYDPYRGIAFKLGAEFDGGLIREIDTDEGGFPHSEIILLVKGEENEENRTGINGFREVYTIRVDSKTNLENFNINPDLANAIGENNKYYFIGNGIDTNIHFSDLQIFDVEERY